MTEHAIGAEAHWSMLQPLQAEVHTLTKKLTAERHGGRSSGAAR